MKIYKNIKALRKEIGRLKRKGKIVAFVPTMGFLHEGHLSLIRKARKDSDCVVVSIFVNPAQFGPDEDFKKYPRDLKRDLSLCKESGVDIVFEPDSGAMYPEGFSTYVNVERLTDGLCGSSRPGHFKGVATVVTKLFNIINPDIAYFGQKDAQQAVVIKKMVKDLDIPVKIKVLSIIREKDGLAMSSRNSYLDAAGRRQALTLYKSLESAKGLYKKGERDAEKIIMKMRELIGSQKDARIDYLSIVDPEKLTDVKKISGKALAAAAVYIGDVRLIDNTVLD